MDKKLYRSNINKMLCGVAEALESTLTLTPTIIRLIWAIFACSGPGIIAYHLWPPSSFPGSKLRLANYPPFPGSAAIRRHKTYRLLFQ